MIYHLFNYAHGAKVPTSHIIGPFTIDISVDHIKNLANSPSTDKHTFTVDNNYNRVFLTANGIDGTAMETAVAIIDDDEIINSKIYDTPSASTIDDLCCLLTFLTGKRVFAEKAPGCFNPKQNLGSLVSASSLPIVANKCFNQIGNLFENRLNIAFVNLSFVADGYEFIGMSAYINSALNAVYDHWWKSNSKYPKKAVIKRAKKAALRRANDSITLSVKRFIAKTLSDENISNEIIEDISKTINSIGQPSALYKLKKFVTQLGVYPTIDSQTIYSRLKHFNQVRNHIVHTGTIPQLDKKQDQERAFDVAAAILFLSLGITQLYICKEMFDIEEKVLRNIKEEIEEFFMEGTFRSHKVYDESYDDFMERLESCWINDGVIL